MSDWRDHAACHGVDQAVFFPGHRGKRNTDAALKICADCPVDDQCLKHALAVPETDGVWGGKTEEQRRQMLPRRRRQSRARCGTEAGRRRHIARGEQPCSACREGGPRERHRRYIESQRTA